ncbi:MAG: FAD-linked oxidase C-terminal domain-containing protein [Acuticoccus sp.]
MNVSVVPPRTAGVPDSVRRQLEAAVPGRLSASASVREHHSRGEGMPDAGLPDLVAFPETTEEVAALVRVCDGAAIPMVPFGTGSSLEGQVAAVAGGLTIDLTGMTRVLSVSQGALDCRVEAGVTRVALNEHLRDSGLFFPLDPGADASIGGMAATRASGTNAVGYGTMREVVLGLTVVTPQGKVIRTGSRARKSAAGYDLTRLYLGSEGTLGVITEVALRLYGLPESIVCATCQFEDLEGAAAAASLALQTNLRPARMELLDEVQMAACIAYSGLEDLDAKPTLFLEFHGTEAAAREQAALLGEIAADCGGSRFREAATPEARSRLWKARHDSYHAVMALAPGKRNMGTDACVPIEHLAAIIAETKRDLEETGLVSPIVGHVGDGNFHLGILFDPADADETERAEALAFRTARRAIALGGTCSGEHGVGLHKIAHMATEHGEALDVMRAIKQTLDPKGLMNPGKMLPPD